MIIIIAGDHQLTVHRPRWSRCRHVAKPAMGLLGLGRAVMMITKSVLLYVFCVSAKLVTTEFAITMESRTGFSLIAACQKFMAISVLRFIAK